ncbi:glycosyltransferase [Algibacter amylolyticus]|uniref:Glycosyltransferase n=1 Tax=Algibacter amylolyticus TaxID=1608400 RepID=A0A5M7AYI4_9FLAO|nr:glycosyltransferase [Algibacter amylolyticus]KAA5822446.1 glycosyltransferase [Algibacter amylolyticus]MBB5269169.1 glycosyltransferase involved in cell wall biosynthesis [Algibacter amylolyticus]TSJ73596.1 glycosyltransferase [Algibacter amylolyticus]
MINNSISIIIPCFNQAQFLEETLVSVFNQSSKDRWECIIVNDGSSDNSEEIALSWTKKDKRFKYFYKENGGLSSARNFGINNAVNNIILPLDSDDVIDKELIRDVINTFNNTNADVVHYDVSFFGEKKGIYSLPNYNYKTLLLQNTFIACTPFKKERYLKIGGYDEKLKSFEDWDLWIRMLNENSKVVKISKPLYYYRKHETGSLSNSFSESPKLYFDLYDYIYTKNKAIYDAHFKNPILAYQQNESLQNFNNKIKNNFIFKVYVFVKTIFKN